jgi:hypothetical protein
MIPKHTQFIEAIKEKKRVSVRYYSHADGGVLDRICAPMNYGPGDRHDGLNRYWFWDYASTGNHVLGLMPKQIEDLQTLGVLFDPADFIPGPSPAAAAKPDGLPKAKVLETGAAPGLVL